ncbi:hypothetical protein PA598K_04811 [Paenibacillus sp. 598K]|uniref:hypothetical protein n=1 Tax=Paenibacillus sp. 598K TaxID=1117987 RepID=UPI000FF91119|nr:hypothetical protein [Paenibacillus sp. 598K]GBF76348.1 hypothetical protein PA598K_04811 [Paenibacillus sp. 598K]
MGGSNKMKLAMLMLVVVAVCVITLSPGLLGLNLVSGGAFERAVAITVLVMCGLVLLYGAYQLVLKSPPPPPPPTEATRKAQTPEDLAAALAAYRSTDGVQQEVEHGLEQMKRMGQRSRSIREVLADRFEESELSYKKFMGVIIEVERLFYGNIRSIMNKLGVFDAADFRSFAKRHQKSSFSPRLVQEKTALYREYKTTLAAYLEANEEIVLKLDKLTLEIAKLSSMEYRDVDELPGMQEIDALIKQTKLYRE